MGPGRGAPNITEACESEGNELLLGPMSREVIALVLYADQQEGVWATRIQSPCRFIIQRVVAMFCRPERSACSAWG